MEHVIEGCQCEGKICTLCTNLRCVGNYTKDMRLKSKLKSQCKICQNAKNKQWRENNQEYDMARKREWERLHPEQLQDQRRRYRKKNASHISELRRSSYAKKPWRQRSQQSKEEYNEKRKIRRNKPQNKEQERNHWKIYYQQRHEQMSKRAMEYFHSHPGYRASIEAKRRTRKTNAGGFYTVAEWEALKVKYNYTCLCCGRKEPEIQLHADHVIPIFHGGSSNIENIQPLCKSCNSSKNKKHIDFRH